LITLFGGLLASIPIAKVEHGKITNTRNGP